MENQKNKNRGRRSGKKNRPPAPPPLQVEEVNLTAYFAEMARAQNFVNAEIRRDNVVNKKKHYLKNNFNKNAKRPKFEPGGSGVKPEETKTVGNEQDVKDGKIKENVAADEKEAKTEQKIDAAQNNNVNIIEDEDKNKVNTSEAANGSKIDVKTKSDTESDKVSDSEDISTKMQNLTTKNSENFPIDPITGFTLEQEKALLMEH